MNEPQKGMNTDRTLSEKPTYPKDARAAHCCQRRDVWEQAWGTTESRGYCGVNGAHLKYVWAYGCERHNVIEGTLGDTGERYCPQHCAWETHAREDLSEPESNFYPPERYDPGDDEEDA